MLRYPCVNSISVYIYFSCRYTCACMAQPPYVLVISQADLLASPISLFRPTCISSPPLTPTAAPTAPGGQQAAGLSGCRALRDGRDDNECPLGDCQDTEGKIGEQNYGMEKKRKRQGSVEVRRAKVYDVI